MVQINPQTSVNTASLSMSSNECQNKIGNTGLMTFRGNGDNLLLQSPIKQDLLELSFKQGVDSMPLLPKVSGFAAMFSRIPRDVVAQINETGKLPENMMVSISPYGGYRLTWKNPVTNGQLTGGTQTLPEHLEVKNNLFGFTSVVPKGYESWLLPND